MMKKFLIIPLLLTLLISCHKSPPKEFIIKVEPSVKLLDTYSKVILLRNRYFIPANSLIEVEYNFKIDKGFKFNKDFRIGVHFIDDEGRVIWQDDHYPPIPTSKWKSGETITYKKVFKIPQNVYYPRISMAIVFYDPKNTSEKYYIQTKEKIERKYTVAKMFVEPEEKEIYRKGWQKLEFSPDGRNSWRWMGPYASYAFKNPQMNVFLNIRGSTILKCLENPFKIELLLNKTPLDTIELKSNKFEKQILLEKELLKDEEWCLLEIKPNHFFVPKECGISDDTRKLSIMINELKVRPYYFANGFYDREISNGEYFRWMSKKGKIVLTNPYRNCVIYIKGSTNINAFSMPPTLKLTLNNNPLEPLKIEENEFSKLWEIDEKLLGTNKTIDLVIECDQSFVPKDKGISNDKRELSVMFKEFYFVPTKIHKKGKSGNFFL